MRFAEKNGVFTVSVGGRSGTPILEMPNITKGNTIVVTTTFLAKTAGNAGSGFNYKVQATKSADAAPLSAQESTVQGNAGWQTTTKTVFFEAIVDSQTGVEEIDFEVVFSKGSLDGEGSIQDFLITGDVVVLITP